MRAGRYTHICIMVNKGSKLFKNKFSQDNGKESTHDYKIFEVSFLVIQVTSGMLNYFLEVKYMESIKLSHLIMNFNSSLSQKRFPFTRILR